MPIDDQFYDRNEILIHTYFKRETFNLPLARALKAPNEQFHPDIRKALIESGEWEQRTVVEEDDVKEENEVKDE